MSQGRSDVSVNITLVPTAQSPPHLQLQENVQRFSVSLLYRIREMLFYVFNVICAPQKFLPLRCFSVIKNVFLILFS